MIILKVTKNQGFTLSLEDTFFEKPQGGQIDPQGLFINYVTLKLPFLNLPISHHHVSSWMITRAPLRYVTPETDTPLYHLFLFFEVEKKPKDTHSPMTHPPMFLSN